MNCLDEISVPYQIYPKLFIQSRGGNSKYCSTQITWYIGPTLDKDGKRWRNVNVGERCWPHVGPTSDFTPWAGGINPFMELSGRHGVNKDKVHVEISHVKIRSSRTRKFREPPGTVQVSRDVQRAIKLAAKSHEAISRPKATRGETVMKSQTFDVSVSSDLQKKKEDHHEHIIEGSPRQSVSVGDQVRVIATNVVEYGIEKWNPQSVKLLEGDWSELNYDLGILSQGVVEDGYLEPLGKASTIVAKVVRSTFGAVTLDINITFDPQSIPSPFHVEV
ncbi:unnamed protein product, partial [Darwinula stevensoni]